MSFSSTALAAMGLALLLAFGGCGSRQQTAPRSVGDPLEGAGAQELFEEGLEYARLGDFIRAEQYLVAAVDRGYPAKEALPVLIDVCVKSSRFDSALSHARPYLERDPENWRLRFVVATLYSALGNGESAQSELEQVLIDQPNEAGPHFSLGKLLWESKPAAATPLLARYLELAPEGKHAREAKSLLRMAGSEDEGDTPNEGRVESSPETEDSNRPQPEEQVTSP